MVKKMRTYPLKMSDIFSDDLLFQEHGGIFNAFKDEIDDNNFPLLADIITDEDSMDFDYHLGHSNEKFISSLMTKLFEQMLTANGIDYYDYKDETPAQQKTDLEDLYNNLLPLIYNRFAVKWKKLFDALNESYNPLENYSMIDTRTPNLTIKDVAKGETDSKTESGVVGFNSVNSKPAGTNAGNQKVDSSNTRTETGSETTRRSGNIGVTTSQQMLESEFEVRKHDIYQLIYNDIDSLICLKIY